MKTQRLTFWFKLKQHFWPDIGLPAAIYTLAALWITWPLITQFSTHVGGAGYGDSLEYARLGWWAKYALQHGLNPFYQSLLAYPDGFFSATQAAQPLIYWPISLLGFVFNPAVAFNLWLLLEIILSGLTAYWLCREVLGENEPRPRACGASGAPSPLGREGESSRSGSPSLRRGEGLGVRLAALFGGLVFMAYPAVQGHLSAGHVNPLSNYALPVVALCLYRLTRQSAQSTQSTQRGGLRTALIGAVALLVLALGNFTFPVFTLLPLILFGGGYLLLACRFEAGRTQAIKMIGWLAVMFGVGAILILPFYVPLLSELFSPVRPAYLQETGWVTYSADPLGFLALSPFTPWGETLAPAFSRAVLGTNSLEGAAYLGLVAVFLAAVALVRRRRAAMLWLVIGLGCMLFSLGPLLKWQDQLVVYTLGDNHSNVVLPWALFQDLPLINATRTPGRFNITTGLALGVLAALGLNVLLSRLDRFKRRGWQMQLAAAGALMIVMLLEYQLFFPFPTISAQLPAYFDSLSERQDVRAVFDVPWDDPLAQKAALYEQVAHQKPLIAGYVSRRTSVDPAELTLLSNAAINRCAENVVAVVGCPAASDVQALLSANGIDVLVYHWQLLDKPSVMAYATDTFGQPVYQDDQIGIFEVPRNTQLPDSFSMALSSTGWWKHDPADALWMAGTGESSFYLYTPKTIDQLYVFILSPLLHGRRLQLSVDGQLNRAWMIQPPTTAINVWLRLEPGFHTLRFSLPDGCTPVPAAPACLLYSDALPDPAARTEKNCTLPDSSSNVCVGIALKHFQSASDPAMILKPRSVSLKQGMSLVGFRALDRVSRGRPLVIETDWHAAQKLPGDYHLFVHLLDQNGKLIAQADTVPGENTFPTTSWAVPQDWVETVSIPLSADLTPGTYHLTTGWYSYPDMTPLQADGQIDLSDVEIGS